MEIELITREVALIHAALRFRAMDCAESAASLYERTADHMHPIGLYTFNAEEAAHICVALNDYANVAQTCAGHMKQAAEVQQLADEFLQELCSCYPLEEAFNNLRMEQGMVMQHVESAISV